MPTNNKTSNLNLNSWLSTDKPKREDFVNDNIILDTAIGQHINNGDIHLTLENIKSIVTSFKKGVISGDGNETKTHTLEFEPSFIIVMMKNHAFSRYDSTNSYTLCNAGVAFNNGYGTFGISLSGNTLTLTQSTSANSQNEFSNLNKYAIQYLYIAFK